MHTNLTVCNWALFPFIATFFLVAVVWFCSMWYALWASMDFIDMCQKILNEILSAKLREVRIECWNIQLIYYRIIKCPNQKDIVGLSSNPIFLLFPVKRSEWFVQNHIAREPRVESWSLWHPVQIHSRNKITVNLKTLPFGNALQFKKHF